MMGLDLDTFLTLPRLAGLTLAGDRLITTVTTPAPDGTRMRSTLWAIDPAGATAPRRLTYAEAGEQNPAGLVDGGVVFTSARPDPDASGSGERDEPPAALWLLPADGGEARLIAAPPAGVGAVRAATDAPVVVFAARQATGAEDWGTDREQGEARRTAGITAQLFSGYPVRHWDHWLDWREAHLFLGRIPGEGTPPTWVDLAPSPGRALEDAEFAVCPDGRRVATTWWTDPDDPRDRTAELVLLEIPESGPSTPQVLTGGPYRHRSPAWSPDGRWVVCVRETLPTPEDPVDMTLWLVDTTSGQGRDLLEGFDRWPGQPAWSADSAGVLFTADDDGHTLPFRVALADGSVTRLAREGAFSDLCPAREGTLAYALRSTLTSPPVAVCLDTAEPASQPQLLPGPSGPAVPAGQAERVEATASDGTRVPGWLVLPTSDEADGPPAPLVVFLHGGPLGSWSSWHWRWNPHLLAASGYAVLLPDPALSTGYGHAYIRRGWGRWGAEPYTDVMALVEAVAAREDIDGDRMAAAGGSFGGYLANWIATQTDRFRAIVTHASIWNLETFHGTTDLGTWWERHFGDPDTEPDAYRAWSPHRFADRIRTPMLVIHGERDFRVPVSEGLMLWTALRRHGVPGSYLHFGDEHHWIRKPGHVRLWYRTVLAFLDHHVRGAELRFPEELGAS